MPQHRFRRQNVYGRRPVAVIPKIRRKLPRPRKIFVRSTPRRSTTRTLARAPDEPHLAGRA